MDRRKFLLSSAAAVSTVAVAGCADENGENGDDNGTDDEPTDEFADVDFPTGLSGSGITDVDALVGDETGILSTSSVSIDIASQFPETTENTDIQADQESEESMIVSSVESEQGEQEQIQYESGGQIYIRSVTPSPDGGDDQVDYQIQDTEFNAESVYAAGFVRDAMEDVDYGAPDSVEGGFTYTAELSDIGSENPIRQSFDGNVQVLDITAVFYEDGLVDSVSIDIETDEQQLTQSLDYYDYNETEIVAPDWLDDAEEHVAEVEANQPTGDVSFDQDGSDVVVTINELENTEEVTVAAGFAPVAEGLGVGESVTVTEEEYMMEGQVSEILVLTEYNQEFVEIASYTPE